MSYDFALAKACEHRVLFENLTLDPYARNTLKFLRPPSSPVVQIRVNGQEVPPEGLWSTSEFRTAPGPFRIRKDKNDRLLFRYNGGAIRTIRLQSNSYLTAQDLVEFLARQIPELSFSLDGTRCLFTAPAGVKFDFPDPRWSDRAKTDPNTEITLATFRALGIAPGRVFQPNRLFPGWNVITNPNSYTEDKVVLFQEPIRNGNPVFEVSYFTRDVDCRRCNGSSIEYDYTVQAGTFETVQNTDLLLQEFDKFIFTRLGSHWKWKWLGSQLSDRIGSKANVAGQMANAMIELDIQQAFQNYQNVKLQQDRIGFQRVSDAEFPFTMTGLQATSPPQDPTVSIVKITIQSRSRGPVEVTRLIDGVQSFFLPGSSVPYRFRA